MRTIKSAFSNCGLRAPKNPKSFWGVRAFLSKYLSVQGWIFLTRFSLNKVAHQMRFYLSPIIPDVKVIYKKM